MSNSDSKILKKRIKAFCDYLDNIYIIEDWKKQLVDPNRLGIQTQVYLYYAELFWYAFNEHRYKSEILDKLCISGYLYFNSLILQDKLLDDNKKYTQSLPLISFLQEETIKILISVFPVDSPFWKKWHSYRIKYVESITFDKNSKSFTEKDFETFAINKSIYAQVAIDCCYNASKKDKKKADIYNKLLRSHELFSIGLQILDDLSDIEEDYNNNQKNIIINRCTERANNSNLLFETVNELKKYFYISGCAEEILNECMAYLTNAKKEVKSIKNLDLWVSSIDIQLLKTFRILSNIKIYNKEIFAKTYFSNVYLHSDVPVEDRIKLTEEFIYKLQDKDGSWSDMITNQGISKVWSTAFIAWNLSQNCPVKNNHIKKAIDFILENRSADLWGYNSDWISDIDSSSNALFALQLNNQFERESFDIWCNWQKPNGAFSTYVNDNQLKQYLGGYLEDFSGWTNDHICVSAFAYYYLSTNKNSNHTKNKLYDYLIKKQNGAGLWESYWWTSPIYSTAFIVKGLINEDYEKNKTIINKAIEALLNLRNENYSFACLHTKESAFYTLLVLDTLCSSDKTFNEYRDSVNKIINWVFNNQLDDGSFLSSYILQVPAPEEKNPAKIDSWSIHNKEGVNVVRNDFMRLFTSSIAYQSLSKYYSLINNNIIIL